MTAGPVIDPRRQPPVDVAPPRPHSGRFSMTLLSLGDRCMRAAYLSLLYGGGAPSHEMARGSLYHAFQERAMWTLIEREEPNLYAGVEQELVAEFEAANNRAPNVPELDAIMAAARSAVADHTAVIVDEVLREHPEWVVPQADVDDVREMAYHWAVGSDVRPDRVVGLETKFLLRLPGGAVVSMKVDVLHADDQPDVLCVDDAKTSFHMLSAEEVERDYQLKLYAAGVAFGRPVEKVACDVCRDFEPQEPGHEVQCDACGGRGHVEVLGDPLGDGVNFFRLRQVYPRYLGDDGLVRTSKPFVISRTDLHDFLADVERDVAKFEAAYESGRWDAVPGSHCAICPAWSECPLPEFLRIQPFDPEGNSPAERGYVESYEDAQLALMRADFYRAMANAEVKKARNWSKQGGPVRVGADVVWEWHDAERRETDYAGLDQGVYAAVEFGEPFDLSRYRRTRVSTSFRRRKLTKAEIAEEGGVA